MGSVKGSTAQNSFEDISNRLLSFHLLLGLFLVALFQNENKTWLNAANGSWNVTAPQVHKVELLEYQALMII